MAADETRLRELPRRATLFVFRERGLAMPAGQPVRSIDKVSGAAYNGATCIRLYGLHRLQRAQL